MEEGGEVGDRQTGHNGTQGGGGGEIEGLRRRWLDEIKKRFPLRWENKWRDGSG